MVFWHENWTLFTSGWCIRRKNNSNSNTYLNFLPVIEDILVLLITGLSYSFILFLSRYSTFSVFLFGCFSSINEMLPKYFSKISDYRTSVIWCLFGVFFVNFKQILHLALVFPLLLLSGWCIRRKNNNNSNTYLNFLPVIEDILVLLITGLSYSFILFLSRYSTFSVFLFGCFSSINEMLPKYFSKISDYRTSVIWCLFGVFFVNFKQILHLALVFPLLLLSR